MCSGKGNTLFREGNATDDDEIKLYKLYLCVYISRHLPQHLLVSRKCAACTSLTDVRDITKNKSESISEQCSHRQKSHPRICRAELLDSHPQQIIDTMFGVPRIEEEEQCWVTRLATHKPQHGRIQKSGQPSATWCVKEDILQSWQLVIYSVTSVEHRVIPTCQQLIDENDTLEKYVAILAMSWVQIVVINVRITCSIRSM